MWIKKGSGEYKNYWLNREGKWGACLYFFPKMYVSVWGTFNGKIRQKGFNVKI